MLGWDRMAHVRGNSWCGVGVTALGRLGCSIGIALSMGTTSRHFFGDECNDPIANPIVRVVLISCGKSEDSPPTCIRVGGAWLSDLLRRPVQREAPGHMGPIPPIAHQPSTVHSIIGRKSTVRRIQYLMSKSKLHHSFKKEFQSSRLTSSSANLGTRIFSSRKKSI